MVKTITEKKIVRMLVKDAGDRDKIAFIQKKYLDKMTLKKSSRILHKAIQSVK